ncbi:MAG: MBOAT family protein [Lachnospiraceae bacterium]|nr:MBOAT family protein [Lachnospiraceae bacterium]
MLFNSLEFLLFFPIVVLGYYIIPKKARYIWLLIGSYYFYMCWNAVYALLILSSTIFTYLGGLVIGKTAVKEGNIAGRKKHKLILVIVLLVNLGILGYFKYSNFLLEIVESVAGLFGSTLTIRKADILLPVGISFYTFQALSYSIDVYRGDIRPEKNFFKYALFVSFFPQLVAGPIERSKNLLSQIQQSETIRFDSHRVWNGLVTMVWGLFLKMVIADRLAILVDNIFDKYYFFGGVELIIGAVAFALQIYCDFASYSTMAIGAAKVLGFTLMENFDAPYFALSVKEFWRSWHISLSTWFRDYLYIPLGGNRRGKARKHLNLLVTFLISGLWHGAGLTFIIWGGLHGLYQVIGDALLPERKKIVKKLHINTDCFSHKFLKMFITFVLVDFAWIFFRADNVLVAFDYIRRIFTGMNPWVLTNGGLLKMGLSGLEFNILMVALVILFAVDLLKYRRKKNIADFILEQNVWFQYLCIIGLIMTIFVFGVYGATYDAKAFIYFQF